jgi:pilus assembly protein CpaB
MLARRRKLWRAPSLKIPMRLHLPDPFSWERTMRRSSIMMLVAAVVLGMLAVFLARMFLLPDSNKPAATANAVQTVPAVVAAQPFAFGEKITAEKLKVVPWPAAGLPAGTFQRVVDAIGENNKVALRAIDTNELLTAAAISGKETRLSASALLGPTMRAASIPISESSAAGGFVAPGDRVDVFLTRPADGDSLPYTDMLVQNVRVLAVGQDSNVGKDKPEVTRTATVEVTPLQAQKLALAQNVGSLSLSLRNIVDESRLRLETAQIFDLNDGTVTRVLKRSAPAAAAPPPAATGGGAPAMVARPSGPSIEIFRGAAATRYSVPSGS